MKSIYRLLFVAAMFLGLGCSRRDTVFRADVTLANHQLSFAEPQIFEFRTGQGLFDWELDLTFAQDSLSDWKHIPLYYIHVDPAGKESEGKVKIPIKNREDEWEGEVTDKGIRLVATSLASDLRLSEGIHQFKLYGDNPKQGEPVPGIVRLTFFVIQKQ